MAINVKKPPVGVTDAQWAQLPLAERALLMAAQECDVYRTMEDPPGTNRGPRVDTILRTAQSVPGEPWCAAFVYWCCVQAGFRPNVVYPASVVSWRQWATKHGRWSESPQRGRLFVIDRPGCTHIGFVAKVCGENLRTIEGNTNDGGSREGVRTQRRLRGQQGIAGYIDLSGL